MFNEELPAIVSLGVLAAAFLAAFLHDIRRGSRRPEPSSLARADQSPIPQTDPARETAAIHPCWRPDPGDR